MPLPVQELVVLHFRSRPRRDQRLYLGTILQKSDPFVCRPVYQVVFWILCSVEQAVVQERVEVKVHLFGAQIRPGHDVCFLYTAIS